MKKYKGLSKYTKNKSRPMRQADVAIDKDLKIRGGFAPSFKPTRKGVERAVETHLRDKTSAMQQGRSFVGEMAKAKVAIDVAGSVINAVEQVRALGQTGDTIAVSKTSATGFSDPNSSIGRKYKTEFHVGQPCTRTVNQKARLNGTRKLTQFDTTVSNLDPETAPRQSLTITTGANQKMITAFDNRSYWSLGELESLVDAASYTRTTNQAQTCYWMTKYFGVKYQFMNTNKFLKMKVKMHFLRPNQDSYDPKDWISDCVKLTGLPTPADTNKLFMPYNLQLTTGSNTTEKFNVGIDPVLGTMSKSKLFDIAFTTAKTFEKTLEPGETWELDYRHSTGPGLKVNDLVASLSEDTWAVTAAGFYYPMIETIGRKVEVVDSENTASSFIATNSGAIQCEMKKYCEIVQADTSPSTVYASATGGYTKNRWDYRIFTDFSTTNTDGTAVNRRFNVDYADILRAGETAASGKYIIPVVTDVQQARAGKSNDGAV